MTFKVLINGAFGKMGSISCETIEKHPDFHLKAKLGRNDDLTSNIKKHHIDIVIDFTTAEKAYDNAYTIIQAGAHPVIGTSGMTTEQINGLRSLCHEKKLGGIIAANFSIGAILMIRFASLAARYLPEVEIIETHHQNKLDAPSGTAQNTALLIDENRKEKPNSLTLKETIEGSRGAICNNVRVHALRLPGFVASQNVVFGSQGENLSLVHHSIDRSCFMPGLILACQKVCGLTELVYGLEHLMD